MFGEAKIITSAELIELKRRQEFRKSHHEIREFSSKLQNIHIRREQLCQIKEKEVSKLTQEVEERRTAEDLTNKVREELRVEEENKKWKSKDKQIYGELLLCQHDLMERQRTIINEESKILEKMQSTEFLKKIKEENKRIINEKKHIIEATLHEMNTFKKAKEISSAKERIILLKECKKMEEIRNEREETALRLLKEHKTKLELRESIKNRIAENILAQQLAQQERDHLIQELQEHEYLTRSAFIDNNDDSIKQQGLQNTKIIIGKQIEANVARQQALKDEEEIFRRHLLDSLEIEKHQETEEKIKRRNTKLKYAQDISTQIQVNKEKRKKEESELKATHDYVRQFNEELQKKINEEKQLLLEEHLRN